MTLSPTQRQWLKDLAEGRNPWERIAPDDGPKGSRAAATTEMWAMQFDGLLDDYGNLTPAGRDAVRGMSGGGR